MVCAATATQPFSVQHKAFIDMRIGDGNYYYLTMSSWGAQCTRTTTRVCIVIDAKVSSSLQCEMRECDAVWRIGVILLLSQIVLFLVSFK